MSGNKRHNRNTRDANEKAIVAHGLCACGCGEPTSLAPRNRVSAGWVKGQPVKFRPGHLSRLRPDTRKAACQNCRKQFTARKRGARRQKTCSLECSVAIRRDYTGAKNPNFRGANHHTCAACAKEFDGKRPKGRYSETYCSSRCAAKGNDYVKRFADRRDLNEPELLEAARSLGAMWFQFPPLDGWLWHAKIGWVPVEIKQPRRKGKAREFTPAQLRFFEWCDASSGKYLVWHTTDDVLRDLGARKTT